MKKIYIISGEASGDLHGSNLIRALRQKNPNLDIRGWGGDLMQEAGAQIVKHYRELAFMGFSEVLLNLRTIIRNFSICKADILDFQPDLLILIDYPGFNLRMAKWAKKHQIPVVYYISPQIWAWKEKRVNIIKACVDKMLVILPFEKAFYKKWNYDADYVGHPLVEVIEQYKQHFIPQEKWKNKKIIALLPGSRKQEIKIKLPIMLQVCSKFPEYEFVIAKAPGLEQAFYDSFITKRPNVSMVFNETYSLLCHAKAALVTSGTATLETALFGVPEVICYKGSNLSYQIAKRLIKIKFIGLANLIMDREVVKELIQNELNEEQLTKELDILLHDEDRIRQLRSDYSALTALLKQGGHASSNAAELILNFMKSSSPDK